MKPYWILTLLLIMTGVGMSLDLREVISRWTRLPKGYWLRVVAATFLLPPLFAILFAETLPLTLDIRNSVLLISIAPGAPMLTRMVSKKGILFDTRLAASYQIVIGLLVPILTPLLLYGMGRYYHREVYVSPLTLAWQVASMQFLPLTAGLLIKHYWPRFAAATEPWMSRLGNVMLLAYLVIILLGLGKALIAVGLAATGVVILFAIACLAFGHFLAGPTIALSNANRHVGLALLIAGLNTNRPASSIVPFFAAYALLAPLLLVGYAVLMRRRSRTS